MSFYQFMLLIIPCLFYLFLAYQFYGEELCHPLLLLPPLSSTTFFHVFWIVLVQDLVLHFGCMVVKVSLLYLTWHFWGNMFRRWKLVLFVENLTHLYRILLPIPLWTSYLLFFHQTIYSQLIGGLLCGLYFVLKGPMIVRKCNVVAILAQQVMKGMKLFGRYITTQDISEEDSCAICRDTFSSDTPLLQLHTCQHFFCEKCIEQWLQREPSCPICRKKVSLGSIHNIGNETLFLFLPELF